MSGRAGTLGADGQLALSASAFVGDTTDCDDPEKELTQLCCDSQNMVADDIPGTEWRSRSLKFHDGFWTAALPENVLRWCTECL